MTVPMTAAELYRHGLRLPLEKDVPGWVDLWDADGVLEFPFAPQGHMTSYRDYGNPLGVQQPGADFVGAN
ncbi:hypothetical protein [Streptomyces lasiicapitis]|uniref:Uncharacterized protein n=1 Tax=Streptomyces lasiicapitis TaxID=1923961 RepID=A0ABQ2M8R1_9ACTN|nr:hypothetical protein [Streptomyces lasiicapitis]GGO48620.1 hypothetical protein GCM10012286_44640 [Streptomyces lasiicapitis]